MLAILEYVKEAVLSVFPVFIVLILLALTITPLSIATIMVLIVGTVLMIIGMPLFLLGVDISITPMGEQISEVLTNSNRLWLVLIGGCGFGFIVTVAEPDLHILANQVNAVTEGQFNSLMMILLVSLGVGIMIAVALVRIIRNIPINRIFLIIYAVIFLLGIFTQPDFLAIAFDASGSTTGAISVPFILALSVSIASMTRSAHERETNDGFGMLGIASTGAILAVMLQGAITGTGPLEGKLPVEEMMTGSVLEIYIQSLPGYAEETLIALLPIVIIYLIVNFFWIKISHGLLKRIFVGAIYTYIGLVLFITGVNTGFIEASRLVGYQLATLNMPWLLVFVGMLFGVITIPAEPSVHVLTKQIEDETAGSIRAGIVLFTLCLGVAVAVGFSILRIIVPELQLWHILLPCLVMAIWLSYTVPDIFVGIAFDSGGVAAGTMTAAFILPFAQGAAEFIPEANVVLDGFGVIALVSITPLIAVQLLGLIYKWKTRNVAEIEVEEVEEG